MISKAAITGIYSSSWHPIDKGQECYRTLYNLYDTLKRLLGPCQQLGESEEPWPMQSCLSGLMSVQRWFSEGNANMGGWANSPSRLLTAAVTVFAGSRALGRQLCTNVTWPGPSQPSLLSAPVLGIDSEEAGPRTSAVPAAHQDQGLGHRDTGFNSEALRWLPPAAGSLHTLTLPSTMINSDSMCQVPSCAQIFALALSCARDTLSSNAS